MDTIFEIIEATVDFLSRYLLPRSLRLRLFTLAVFDIARTLPPAIYLTHLDTEAYTMQIDLLRKHYRLEK